ncbi:MAG: hypothetical protein ABIB43_03660 [archaeon]
MDFIIGFMIFSIALILASRFLFNEASTNEFDLVKADAETMSEYLMSEGIPGDWTNETLVRLGLLTNNRLNITKLGLFYNLSYDDSRKYLTTKYDFFVFFQKNETVQNISGNGCGYGHGAVTATGCTISLSGVDYEDLVKVIRYTLYNNLIIEMVLYVWN